jgi:hypothetical protein
MANPSEWGPLLWKIIHSINQKLGNQTNNLLQKDEMNYYNNFTKQIGFVLPCKVCKKHYYDYAIKNKKNIEYYDFKDYAINYYFSLQNEINQEKNKILFTKNELSIYSIIKTNELNSLIIEFNKLFQNYILHHYISANAVKDFNLALLKLRNIIYF